MTHTPPPPSRKMETDLVFDPDAVLLREAGSLLDPRFLATLYAELEIEHGVEDAAHTLLQIGFLHGLQDAQRVVDASFGAQPEDAAEPLHPQLAIQYQCRSELRAEPEFAAAIELRGSWPQGRESVAHGEDLNGGRCVCFMSAGYTSGWFSAIHEADLLVVETHCRARGDDECRFVAREREVWRALGPTEWGEDWERVRAMLDAIPFEEFRRLVHANGEQPDPFPVDQNSFDPEAAVVHIWGPVMVIPFSGPEEAMQAIGLIGRDPGARDVTVLVLDLTGIIIDDAFGAAALERIVETVEAWGAEAVFAGIDPLSEEVVAGLDRQPLAILKDINSAIAVAFQIADAQVRVA